MRASRDRRTNRLLPRGAIPVRMMIFATRTARGKSRSANMKEVESRDAVADVQLTMGDARVAEQTYKQAAATGRYSRALDDLRDSYREGKSTLSEYEAAAAPLKASHEKEVEALGKTKKAHEG